MITSNATEGCKALGTLLIPVKSVQTYDYICLQL